MQRCKAIHGSIQRYCLSSTVGMQVYSQSTLWSQSMLSQESAGKIGGSNSSTLIGRPPAKRLVHLDPSFSSINQPPIDTLPSPQWRRNCSPFRGPAGCCASSLIPPTDLSPPLRNDTATPSQWYVSLVFLATSQPNCVVPPREERCRTPSDALLTI